MARSSSSNPLFHESPLGILVLDRDGRIQNANPAACRCFARPRERLTGSTLTDWILPADRFRSQDGVEGALQESSSLWRARIRRGDGLPRVQEFKAVPLRREDRVEGALLFLRDLNEGREGRPEILQLQRLIENLPGQFVLVTDKGGKIRYSSGLGRTHFRDNGSVLGLDYARLLGGEREGEATVEELFREVGSGNTWAGIQWHRRKDGAAFPVEVYAAPQLHPRSGQVLGVLLVGRDLSEIRKWRERSERVEPLARIGSLVTRISREMEEGVCRLETALWETDGSETLEPELQDSLAREVRALRGFAAGVAEFGSRGNLRPHPLDLPELVHEALERVEGRLGARDIHPLVEIPPNLPAVFADRRYLGCILDALLGNALDALDGDPEPLLKLVLRNGPDGVLLSITNSGAGISRDWVEEIFDPFYTSKEGRPGLGLAVARGMLKAQDGRIWAEVPEEGLLTLALELPREAPNRIRTFRPVPLDLSRARSVLVVDDDEAVRVSLRAFLEKVGYQVREAWSGRSALAELTSARLPEIVITDLKMSDGSGYWFLEELEREFPRLVRRTVILTGDADHEAADGLAQRTGCPLVRKPFELPELMEVLDQVALGN